MKAVGIVLAGGKRNALGALTMQRNVAAIPVGGSYRAIDFALSNLSNSGIKKVAVISQHNTRSLTDHISSSKWWGFGRKKTGLFLFTPHMISAETFSYRGTADAIYQNVDFLKKSNEPYVVIVSGEQVTKMDYDKLIQYHIEKNADITIMCKNMQGEDVREYGVVKLDEELRMVDLEEKPLEPQGDTVSLGVYVIGRELLIHLLEELESEARYNFVSDILIRYRRKLKIYGYMFDGYWKTIKDIPAFYEANMDFLNPEVRKFLFNTAPHIFTKAKDEPPAKFNDHSNIANSIISGGDIINGTVEQSVLFRKVFVGENAVIKNSIIMEGCTIGRGAVLENVILDKQIYVSEGQRLIGTPEDILVYPKRSII